MTRRATSALDTRGAGAKRFRGKIAIVTGAGQGIGRATARRLAEEGAAVMIAERYADSAERTCEELRDYGVEAETFVADVGSPETAKGLVEATKQRFGRIDVLVNNAGGSIYGPKYGWEYTPDEIAANIQNNLWTTLWCCWATLPHMIEQRSGAIVNVGSTSPHGTKLMPYAAAKGGVFAITTCLALEAAPMGVRINAIAPFLSGVNPDDSEDKFYTRIPGERYPRDPKVLAERRERLLATYLPFVPLGRPGTAQDQAATIAFLASDDAAYITGQIIEVAGGTRRG